MLTPCLKWRTVRQLLHNLLCRTVDEYNPQVRNSSCPVISKEGKLLHLWSTRERANDSYLCSTKRNGLSVAATETTRTYRSFNPRSQVNSSIPPAPRTATGERVSAMYMKLQQRQGSRIYLPSAGLCVFLGYQLHLLESCHELGINGAVVDDAHI